MGELPFVLSLSKHENHLIQDWRPYFSGTMRST
jgi:hypothetical protein